MPVLHIGDMQINATVQQLTAPALHILNSSGELYHVAMVPNDGGIYEAAESLVYQSESVNVCQSIVLDAGVYRVEMRGGMGGKPSRCYSGTGQTNFSGSIVSSVFKLNTQTVVYALRGGDGNDSALVNRQQVAGGGASGVDSILVAGNRVVRAYGGPGTKCRHYHVSLLPSGSGGAAFRGCTGGGGGVYTSSDMNNGMGAYTGYWAVRCSGGGSGAGIVSSIGGVGGDMGTTSGDVGSSVAGGSGGDIVHVDGLSSASGGRGGDNVMYSCGGQYAISYGGGGGGGSCFTCLTATGCSNTCFDGGDGGTGSTGSSDSSYIKIYKIG